MTDEHPHRVKTHCPDCQQHHTIVWPPNNPDTVTIQCTTDCQNTLTVDRDGEIHDVE